MTDKSVPTGIDQIESLQGLAVSIEEEIKTLSNKISPLQHQLDAAKEKLDLVNRLIHLSAPTTNNSQETKNQKTIPLTTTGSVEIETRIEELLRSQNKPLHISKIRSLLINMGIPLPGRGDEANIILRLRRANDRFIRTERGVYGLKEWNNPEYKPTPRKKRILRRKGLES